MSSPPARLLPCRLLLRAPARTQTASRKYKSLAGNEKRKEGTFWCGQRPALPRRPPSPGAPTARLAKVALAEEGRRGQLRACFQARGGCTSAAPGTLSPASPQFLLRIARASRPAGGQNALPGGRASPGTGNSARWAAVTRPYRGLFASEYVRSSQNTTAEKTEQGTRENGHSPLAGCGHA